MGELLKKILKFPVDKQPSLSIGGGGTVVVYLFARFGLDISPEDAGVIAAGAAALFSVMVQRLVTPVAEADKKAAVGLALPEGTSMRVLEQVMKTEPIAAVQRPEEVPAAIDKLQLRSEKPPAPPFAS